MEKTLIVSDIHLSYLKPEITQYFLGFLKTLAGQAQNLYILGDLFDYWVGDEEIKKPSASAIVNSLKEFPRAVLIFSFCTEIETFFWVKNLPMRPD